MPGPLQQLQTDTGSKCGGCKNGNCKDCQSGPGKLKKDDKEPLLDSIPKKPVVSLLESSLKEETKDEKVSEKMGKIPALNQYFLTSLFQTTNQLNVTMVYPSVVSPKPNQVLSHVDSFVYFQIKKDDLKTKSSFGPEPSSKVELGEKEKPKQANEPDYYSRVTVTKAAVYEYMEPNPTTLSYVNSVLDLPQITLTQDSPLSTFTSASSIPSDFVFSSESILVPPNPIQTTETIDMSKTEEPDVAHIENLKEQNQQTGTYNFDLQAPNLIAVEPTSQKPLTSYFSSTNKVRRVLQTSSLQVKSSPSSCAAAPEPHRLKSSQKVENAPDFSRGSPHLVTLTQGEVNATNSNNSINSHQIAVNDCSGKERSSKTRVTITPSLVELWSREPSSVTISLPASTSSDNQFEPLSKKPSKKTRTTKPPKNKPTKQKNIRNKNNKSPPAHLNRASNIVGPTKHKMKRAKNFLHQNNKSEKLEKPKLRIDKRKAKEPITSPSAIPVPKVKRNPSKKSSSLHPNIELKKPKDPVAQLKLTQLVKLRTKLFTELKKKIEELKAESSPKMTDNHKLSHKDLMQLKELIRKLERILKVEISARKSEPQNKRVKTPIPPDLKVKIQNLLTLLKQLRRKSILLGLLLNNKKSKNKRFSRLLKIILSLLGLL
ncbi:hypothetical protein HYT84_04585 [Candidatus Micrarchaeota archaeon]|nr:hypothetical protein [Candidatus Micrarchaeota archaeon]